IDRPIAARREAARQDPVDPVVGHALEAVKGRLGAQRFRRGVPGIGQHLAQQGMRRRIGAGVEIAGEHHRHAAWQRGDPRAQQPGAFLPRGGIFRPIGEMGVEQIEALARARLEQAPGDHARIEIAPADAPRLLGRVRQPE
ncbi:hypothetical protein QU38_01210, partial [Staphylococcus aureus]